MNRKKFLKNLGLLFGAAIVAPKDLLSKDQHVIKPNLNIPADFTGQDIEKYFPPTPGTFTITIKNIGHRNLTNVSLGGRVFHDDLQYKVNNTFMPINAVCELFSSTKFKIEKIRIHCANAQQIQGIHLGNQFQSWPYRDNFIFGGDYDLKINDLEPGGEIHFLFFVKEFLKPNESIFLHHTVNNSRIVETNKNSFKINL